MGASASQPPAKVPSGNVPTPGRGLQIGPDTPGASLPERGSRLAGQVPAAIASGRYPA